MIRTASQRIFDPPVECCAPSSRRTDQEGALGAVLARLVESSAFYREKLRRSRHADAPGIDRLVELPFTTRAELAADQAAAPPFGTAPAVAVDRAAVAGRSGVGFSVAGHRLNVIATGADVRRQGALFARAMWEAGVRPGDRVYVADDPRYNLVAMSVIRALTVLGALDVYVAAERSARTARYVVPVLPPAHVFLSPTYARYLPDVLAARSGARWPIRSVSGWGEPGYSVPGTRERIAALWNAVTTHSHVAVVDVYALSEAGIIAFGCRDGTGLHVVEDAAIVEIVDPDGDRVLSRGERGEIVITLLGSDALPLLRYRTGDSASIDELACPCGRTGRRLLGIERLAERLSVGGRTVSALDVECALDRLGVAITNFQIVRQPRDDGVLHVRASVSASPPAMDDAAAVLQHRLGVPVSLEIVSADILPAFLHKTLRVTDAERQPVLREELRFQHELERV